MAVSAGIAIWSKQPTPDLPNQVFVQFTDGMGRFFESPEAMLTHITDQVDVGLARILAMAKGLVLDPTFTGQGNVTGKTLTIDVTQNNMVTFSVQVP